MRTTVIVSPDIDLYTMRRMKDEGVVGIRFQFRNVAAPPDLTSFEYRRLMRRAADLDWHVHLHDEGERLPQFIEAIEASGVRLVIDHFGRPTAGQGLNSAGFQAVLRAVERGRTWVKTSAAFRIEPPGDAALFAAALLQHAGAERLMWGSDWPFAAFEDTMTYGQTLDTFGANFPDEAVRRAMDLTALRFYFS
jgi:predicted TIM-barrel fold metal-dependent hydrolase